MNEIASQVTKLALITDRIEARLGKINEQNVAASNALVDVSRNAQQTANEVTSAALERFRGIATAAIADGMRGAVGQYDQVMVDSANRAHAAIASLEERMQRAGSAHWAMAWKAFGAITLASVAVVGTAVYFVCQARQDINDAHWSKELLNATAAGKLAPCPDGGLCAVVGKKWMRVDR